MIMMMMMIAMQVINVHKVLLPQAAVNMEW